jgi:phosphoribosylglycinamide formyltransferase 1
VLRIAWFSTGRGSGSRALLRAAAEAIDGGLPVEIACVYCNRERGEDANSDEYLSLAESYGLPTVTLSSARFRRAHGGPIVRKGDPLPAWRLAYDDEALRLLEPFAVSIGVPAGYMLIFGPRACERLTLLNLHPAAPGGPIGIWQDVIWQLIEQRAWQSGITIFKAEPDVDTGPPLAYCTYPLRDDASAPLWAAVQQATLPQLREEQGENLPLFAEIRRRGALREPPLLLETLRTLAERGSPDPLLAAPIDLTAAVEARLTRS